MAEPVPTQLILQRARDWIAGDPDPECRAELERLVRNNDLPELRERCGEVLTFGTAGLRALVGAGPNRMNRATVARASAGLCGYLKQTVRGAAERGLCIGHDCRRMSREFAEETAAVAAAAGLRTRVFDFETPTPLLAFAVLDQGAAAGVMITASHNQAGYNGYKVFWGNGAQIIPPHEVGIAGCIARQPPASELPRMEAREASARGLRGDLGEELVERYLQGIRPLPLHPELPRDICIAYTALHGVGERVVRRALQEAGFRRLHSVAEQARPDMGFPTVARPNPEEPGAMDLVLQLARQVKADLVIANDPDADRMALAAPDRDGNQVLLTGNQAGILLAHYLLGQGDASGKRLVVSSLVSTPLIGEIARHHSARWEVTLTGFKWICNRAIEIERETGERFVFGFEEALGFAVSPLVRDKDGISAALLAADMAAWCQHRGRTLHDELEEAARLYGMVHSRTLAIEAPGPPGAEEIGRMMERLRSSAPKRIGEHEVEAVSDLRDGTRTGRDGARSELLLPRSEVIAIELRGGHRVIVRPSGTEPKLKLYFDLRQSPDSENKSASAPEQAQARLQELVDAFVRWLQQPGSR